MSNFVMHFELLKYTKIAHVQNENADRFTGGFFFCCDFSCLPLHLKIYTLEKFKNVSNEILMARYLLSTNEK